MKKIVTKSLMGKVVLFCLIVVMVPVAAVGYLSFRDAGQALEKSQLEKLEAARDQASKNIVTYFQGAVTELRFLAQTRIVRDAFSVFAFYSSVRGDGQTDAVKLEIGSEKYKTMVAEMDPLFKAWMLPQESSNAYHDILAISGAGLGQIGYTLKQGSDVGTELEQGSLKESPLAKLFEKVMKTGKPAMADFSYYEPAKEASAFVGVPVFKETGEILGMLALRLGPQRIDEILKSTAQVGKTGEAFVVGQDLVMRSNSRQQGILEAKVDTPATSAAFKGEKGIGEIVDGRGVSVLNAWSEVGLKGSKELGSDFDWAIIVQVDAKEAYAPARRLGKRLLFIVPIIGLIVALAALFTARSAARPITAIAEVAKEVSEGNLTAEIPPIKRNDEIGALSTAFGQMVSNLREQTRLVLEGVNVLSSSAAEISTTVAQQTHTSSKTVSAITETTATAEQVRQTATLTNDKARRVAEASRQAARTSLEGSKATQETAQKITLIREQMESIADTVVRLSDQSRAIEDIIATVQDLADQSNLLAVNASIEAARAGDYGKGFAVVAYEIKALADQSRAATAQVRSILEDTAKWVSASVMATEQGSRAVQAGLEQSKLADESIRSVADSVAGVAEAAAVIQTASEQQSEGATQVSAAMTSIEHAMQEQAAGTTEIEQAAVRLAELGRTLKSLVAQYKV